MRIFNVILISFLMWPSSESHAGGIIKCKDMAGKTMFTQNTADCSSDIADISGATESRPNLNEGKVSYRSPARSYISEKGRWDIHVEDSLRNGNKKLYDSALKKLNETLDFTFSVMPSNSRKELANLKVFLLWGDASPLGGRKSGMSYIRKGEPENYSHLDKRWEHSLIIYSADNFMYLNELWSRKAIFHELAHAWHIINWPEKHPPIFEAWKSAKASQRYLNVRDIKGNTIKSAYASSNQLEYFAELSAMYFVGGNYHPYDKAGLQQYDPIGYKMIEKLWN